MQAPIDTPGWRAVPKVVLHDHLDGGLRPETMLALCRARGIAIPVSSAEAVAQWLHGHANSGSLERYLMAFGPTVQAMASEPACEQVAYEAVMDVAADGAVLAEFRMAPLLLEPHGLGGEEAVAAMLRGLARGAHEAQIGVGLIVCGMRHEAPESTLRAAQLAARFAGRGVVGFDLAGAELGFPAGLHAQALACARSAGLGITLHAGEADAGERVIEAIELGATRIGHGVRIAWGPDAADNMARAADAGVHFEVCLTSNVHTGVCARLTEHPLPQMLAAGLSVSIQTDNRLMSQVSAASECAAASAIGVDRLQILQGMQDAARASFLPLAQRQWALARNAAAIA